MKNAHLATMAAALTILLAGCDKNTSTDNSAGTDTNTTAASAQEATTNAWEKTKEATANAWVDIKESLSSAKDYSYDKKDQFVTNAQADLDSLDQKIQSMSAKADDSLRAKRAALDQKLTDVKNSTQDTWDSTRDSFVSAYDNAKDYVKQEWNGSSTNSLTTTNSL